MAVHLTRSNCEGFQKCCISNGLDGTDNGVLWNDSEGDGNGSSECKKDEGTGVKTEQCHYLVKVDNDMLCASSVLNSKLFG